MKKTSEFCVTSILGCFIIVVVFLLPAIAFADAQGPYTAGTVSGANWTYDTGSLKTASESSDDNRCNYNDTAQNELVLTSFGFNIPTSSTITNYCR